MKNLKKKYSISFFLSAFLWVTAWCGMADLRGATPSSSEEKNVLHIYNWADYLPQSVIKKFEKETGIRIIYDVFDSPEMLDAKLLAASSGYDLVFPSAWPDLTRQIPAGVYLPLEYARLPNAKHLDPVFMKRLDKVDPGHCYALPYLWGTTGFAYNVKMVNKCLKEAPVNSLRMLFDKEVVKKLSVCGVSLLDSPIEVFPAVLIYLGIDPNTQKREDLQKATELLLQVMPYLRKFDSHQFIGQLINKEIGVAQAYSSYGNQAVSGGKEASSPQEIRYVIPEEGGLLWIDMMAIPKDAPHKNNAHLFINFLLKPEIMAEITNYTRTANCVKKSQIFVDKAILENKSIYPSEEVISKLWIDDKKSKNYQRSLLRQWMKVKMGI